MAAIRKHVSKDGLTSFLARVRLKGHPPVTKSFQRLANARTWAKSTESALKERRYFRARESEPRTIADLIERCREGIRDDPRKVAARRAAAAYFTSVRM